MAEILGTVSSLLQLLDTALKAREYVQDFRHAVQEKKRLLSEMGDLRTLLEELRNRITANSTSSVLQQTKGPLAALKSAMELFTEDLRPGGGPLTAFTRRLKWTMWNKKEAAEHLTRFEQFKSQLHLWLSLEIQSVSSDMGERHHTDKVAAGVDCQERR
ncbi:hypothetical protein B0H14DRAFT_2613782 [Mycena olivaceomarginata]|nr:hypothetical protein B0H14DRAFT_2613782 [Mycena olivaceomarginata]